MTHIHPLTTQGAPQTQYSYGVENNEFPSISDAISTIRNELPTIIEEAQKPLKKELQELKNLLKDQIQQSKRKDEVIQALIKTKEELTESLKQSSIAAASHTPIKNNIIYSARDANVGKKIMRTHGFSKNYSEHGIYAKNDQVMVEFVSTFPKKFDLDIKGYFTEGYAQELPENTYFEVHIGKNGEDIRHTKTFRLFGHHGSRTRPDFATVKFETEDEDNNTIWINMPGIPYTHDMKATRSSGLDLHLLNIIPRQK